MTGDPNATTDKKNLRIALLEDSAEDEKRSPADQIMITKIMAKTEEEKKNVNHGTKTKKPKKPVSKYIRRVRSLRRAIEQQAPIRTQAQRDEAYARHKEMMAPMEAMRTARIVWKKIIEYL